MADVKAKVYEVLEGKKYTGKHKVFNSGEKFEESALFGDLDIALKGSEKHKIKPTIKLSTGAAKVKK